VPEIIKPGVSGFIADTADELAECVRRAIELPRAQVRAEFDRRFTVAKMAEQYERLYTRLIAATGAKPRKKKR
jgi:glycosyltransferase involved in cell wall biosynthesis